MIKPIAIAIAAATATALASCSTAALDRTVDRHANGARAAVGVPPGAQGRVGNGLVYSTASGDRVQPMPAPGSCRYRGHGLFAEPDLRCTPGALNPAVTQANIDETICRPGGYTRSVRPPESVTEPEKRAEVAAYSNSAPLSAVELDHAVAVGVAGAVKDPRNYYPESNYPGVSPDSYFHNPKDVLEQRLHDLTCRGRMPLAEAQTALATGWVAAYRRYVR